MAAPTTIVILIDKKRKVTVVADFAGITRSPEICLSVS
jgi:hypothetical protein